ncbi:MAG: hypothetical protein DCF22_12545, partial [Leptolyngbya sp.]
MKAPKTLLAWMSAAILLTGNYFFINKAEANHCGPLDFTGTCFNHGGDANTSEIIVGPPVLPPRKPNSSSFHLTCRNVSINSSILSAECNRGGGSYVPTSIGLRGIWNRNGTLQEDPNTNSSSFQLSCRNLSIQGNVLRAYPENVRSLRPTIKQAA